MLGSMTSHHKEKKKKKKKSVTMIHPSLMLVTSFFSPVLLQCFQSLLVSVFLMQIWLTDIGAHLQLKLKGVPQKDPTFEGKPAGLYKVKTTVITVSKSLILYYEH